MHTILSRALALILLTGLLLSPMGSTNPPVGQAAETGLSAQVVPAELAAPVPLAVPAPLVQPVQLVQPAELVTPALQGSMPVFRFPVVPGATTGGMFDHERTRGLVTFYDGRYSGPGYGYYFRCTNPWMYDWVGCQDAVAGEPGCANNRELWYDNHEGVDYEFASNWHTGAYCDIKRNEGLTMPIHSPARAQVLMAGEDANRPGNGTHIRLKHDLNGNGNFNDDNFRSIYLHFTEGTLVVWPGQILEEGQYMGQGGTSGYSSTPHLHFAVQRSSDYFQTNYWFVDPYGWQGAGNDPWGYSNVNLFRNQVSYDNKVYLPAIMHTLPQCINCDDLLSNGGFESGHMAWVEQGSQLVVQVGEPYLTINPHQGAWLGWLGGMLNTSDVLYQNFQVPAGTQTAVLSYYLNVITTDTGGIRDVMAINLRDVNGNMIRQLDYADNTFTPGGSWVGRSFTFTDLASRQGQTLRLSFESTNNGADKTSFFIDSISLRLIAQ